LTDRRKALRQLIAAERAELLEFLRTRSAQDWLAPSLCERCASRSASLIPDESPRGSSSLPPT